MNIVRIKVLNLEHDHVKYGFPRWTHEEQLERAYALGVSEERNRLCKELSKIYPRIADDIFGVGGD